MRTIFMLTVFLSLYACVQDEGKIDNASVSDDDSTGTTSGGTSGGTPTDPLYAYQWHLKNTGQDLGDYVAVPLITGVDINAEDVHDADITGSGVKIVISDSGTDYTHPDLDDNFVTADQRNYSFVDPVRWDEDGSDAFPSGNDAHGTAVAGIAAMEGWNDIGGRGVAPGAQFTAFKYVLSYAAFDHLSSREDKEIHQLNADYDVFNFSYGFNQCFFFDNYDDDIKDQYEFGITSLRSGKGALYVQAAGNDFEDDTCSDLDDFPAFFGNTNATASLSYPEKILIGAVNGEGVKASYSTPGSGIWVSGLGGEGTGDLDDDSTTPTEYAPAIFTSDIRDCSSGYSFRSFINKLKNPFNSAYDTDLNPSCDYTNEMNGTSAATPMVSGVIALMLQANEDLTWREIKYILATTSQKVDFIDPSPLSEYGALSHPDGISTYVGYVYDYKWVKNAADHWYSNWYGFGLVDAEAAVAAAAAWTPFDSFLFGTYTVDEYTDATIVPIPENGDMVSPAIATIPGVTSRIIEAVQVKLTMDHEIPEQLAVHLISPSGTVSRLLLVDSGITSGGSTDYYFQTNAFLDEDAGAGSGDWTIEVYDPEDIATIDIPLLTLGLGADNIEGTPDDVTYQREDTGSILGWTLTIHGH